MDVMMKKIKLIALSFLMLLAACSTDSDDSDDFDASVVCPAEGTNAYGMPNRGTIVDERDGQEYEYTTIGNQVWMAQNLNYDAEGSVVPDCNDSNCLLYGRYYDVVKDTSIDYMPDTELNKDLIKTLCPQGWHVPSKKEWEKLFDIMGGDIFKAATRLRNSDKAFYPDPKDPPGSDDCHFHAIPGGGNKKSNYHFAASYLCSTQPFVDGLDIAIIEGNVGIAPVLINANAYRYEYPIRCIKD
jgi:uncharacterized protein (TIGR02145 family)